MTRLLFYGLTPRLAQRRIPLHQHGAEDLLASANGEIWIADNSMKRHTFLAVAVVMTIAILTILWLRRPYHHEPSESPPLVATNLVAPTPITTTTAAPVLPSAGISTELTNVARIAEAYKQGLADKDQMRRALIAERSKQPLDLYGMVIDQYGQPVVGAKVRGDAQLDPGTGYNKSDTHYTETGADGRFSFLGLHGLGLGIWPQKEGYAYNLKLPSRRRDDYQPDPKEPMTFAMWKLKGPEPMMHAKIHAYIPCDGTNTRFDLLTGKKSAEGDLVVSLTRKPVDIDRGKPFDWAVTLEVPGGGLREITDLYPNEAPENGYSEGRTMHFPPSMLKWDAGWRQSFYFKSRGGQVHGRMDVTIQADFQPPPTFFSAEIYANPSGSRNLEFDPAKQIR
jgi:hypothetical protein